MCGIVGVFAKDSNSDVDVVGQSLDSLGNVEHRGKDNCGITGIRLGPKRPSVSRIRSDKPPHDIFPTSKTDSYKDHNPSLYTLLKKIEGPAILGHTRFTTSGTPEGIVNCQPIIYFLEGKRLEALNNEPKGTSFHFDAIPNTSDIEGWMSVVHNGEVSKEALDRLIEDAGYEAVSHLVSSDTSSLVAYLLMESVERGSVEGALKSLFKNVPGAWSLLGTAYVNGEFSAFATKDRYGVHPLSRTEYGGSLRYASENSAFRRAGINQFDEVVPGEADILHYDHEGQLCAETVRIADPVPRMCAFEVIYNMAPETRIPFNIRIFDPDYLEVVLGNKTLERYCEEKPSLADRTEVFEVSTIRKRIGELLYKTVAGCIDDCDILCWVPKSGLSYAEGIGSASGKTPKELIYINPAYAKERSFQQSTKKEREKAIKKKLLYKPAGECLDADSIYRSTIGLCEKKECCAGACEDSSVTGNAAISVVKKLKAPPSKGGSGADRAGLIIASPPIVAPCYLGINQKYNENLVNAVGEKYGIENPREWAINSLGEFQEKAAEHVGADYMIFGNISLMRAIFDAKLYGFSCVGAMECAPHK